MNALLRWAHPTRGFTNPDRFIPLAEQTSIIVPLGGWLLRQACLQLEAWRLPWLESGLAATTLPSVSVNISGRELLENDFVEEVAEAIRLTNASARRVTLETTETVIMQDTERTLMMLRRLQADGVLLALDGFGTGYSSLSYLPKFPVDILKIDRAVVDGVALGYSDAALAPTIITLGHTLGLRTVAEGLEDIAPRDQLRRLECLRGSGKPMLPPATTHRLLEQRTCAAAFLGAV